MPATLSRSRKRNRGQSLLETVLIMPLLLTFLLNAVNLGYFFFVALNLTASPRSGVEYAIQGGSTPGGPALPLAGPPTAAMSVSYTTFHDMTGAMYNPTSATLQICTPTNTISGSGVNGTGTSTRSNCVTCTTSCGTPGTGSPVPPADPEAPSFILNQVLVTYTFNPIVPGTPFNIVLLPASGCSGSGFSVTCTFNRRASMRAMN